MFSLSLATVAFLYGWGAAALGWPPGRLIATGVAQAHAILRPSFLSPRVYDRWGAETYEPAKVQPGTTLIATLWRDGRSWTPGLRLIDREGRVLHAWRVHPGEILSASGSDPRRLWNGYAHGAQLFDNGDVLLNIETVGSVKLDACSNVLWALSEHSHHSVAPDDDGSFWIPARDDWNAEADMAGARHFDGLTAPLVNNRILKVSDEGKVLDEIQVLDLLFDNGLQRYVAKARDGGPDIMHVNDVEPLGDSIAAEYPLFEAGDLVVSLRNANLVLVLDPDTRTVKWYASEPFIHQHDPDFIGDGWIGIFDNSEDGSARGSMLGGSRIVALQPHTGATRVLFPTPHADPFYTESMGKWQLLENGNLLLTEAQAGRVVEVEPGGATVWEWIAEPANDRWVPEVSEGTRYPLTPDQIAAWACAPHTTEGGEAG